MQSEPWQQAPHLQAMAASFITTAFLYSKPWQQASSPPPNHGSKLHHHSHQNLCSEPQTLIHQSMEFSSSSSAVEVRHRWLGTHLTPLPMIYRAAIAPTPPTDPSDCVRPSLPSPVPRWPGARSSGELGSPEEFAATHYIVEDPPPPMGTTAMDVVHGAARHAGGVAQLGRWSTRPPSFASTATSTPPTAAFQASLLENVGRHMSNPYNLPSHSFSLILGDDPYVVWSAREGMGGEILASQN